MSVRLKNTIYIWNISLKNSQEDKRLFTNQIQDKMHLSWIKNQIEN